MLVSSGSFTNVWKVIRRILSSTPAAPGNRPRRGFHPLERERIWTLYYESKYKSWNRTTAKEMLSFIGNSLKVIKRSWVRGTHFNLESELKVHKFDMSVIIIITLFIEHFAKSKLQSALSVAVAERSSSNLKVGSLIPSIPHLHAEVSLSKMLNPELPLIE